MKKYQNLIKAALTPQSNLFIRLAKNNLNSQQLPSKDKDGFVLKNYDALRASMLAEKKGGTTKNPGMILPTIFKQNVKSNSKLRPFNEIISDVGEIQYFPA